MQSKLTIGETVPSTAKNSRAQYRVFVSCNRCGGEHEMGISVVENGPSDKQSISDLYNGKTLPQSLADLTNNSVSCPKTGRQSTQKNNHYIFLVPSKS